MSLVDDAIEAIKGGQLEDGRRMLEQALEEDESNDQIWLWLSVVVDSDEDREICLENVLALDPENSVAQNALQALRAGAFNPSDITGEPMVDDFAEDDFSEMTFHDQFFAEEDDDFADDELEMPSVMGGSPEPKLKQQKQETKKGFSLNPRMILIGIVVLVLCGVLGSVAAYNLFLGGGDSTPTDGQPGQEAPTEVIEGVPPTETPLPEPTPTVTDTPFVLPTAKPTDEPTATATTVVSPTTVLPTETPTPASE